MERINWARFSKGQSQILVKGIANTEERKRLIGEAIGQLQKDPKTALKEKYLGFKNYQAFGDQRCDCSYGMVPRHGCIVFSVERTTNYDENINHEDTIYFLKCFRDAPGLERNSNDDPYQKGKDNIQEVYRKMRNLELESGKLQEFLDIIEVDEKDEEVIPS